MLMLKIGRKFKIGRERVKKEKREKKKSRWVQYLTKYDNIDLSKIKDYEYDHYKRAYNLEAYIRIIVGLILSVGSVVVFLFLANNNML